jgi:hypothetical protein
LKFLDRFSKKSLNIKFYKNPFIECRVVPCGRKEQKTDPTVAFRNFADATENPLFIELEADWTPELPNILETGTISSFAGV